MVDNPPLMKIGVVADVQYADVDDGYNFHRTTKRYYRSAIGRLHEAVDRFEEEKVDIILQLGDLLDGLCKRNNHQQRALDDIVAAFNKCNVPVYHIIGNHDLYNFSRKDIANGPLNSAKMQNVSSVDPKKTFYFHFSPVAGFRIVVLDSYDFSLLGYDENDPVYKKAKDVLTNVNKNEDLNAPTNLIGLDRRFLKFNGGIDEEQLHWLDKVLTDADKANENVLIATHIPLDINSADNMCLVWNYQQVLDVLHRHKSAQVFFAGHTHSEAYSCTNQTLHHLVWPAILEAVPGTNAFGVVDVYKDRLDVRGCGTMSDTTLSYFT